MKPIVTLALMLLLACSAKSQATVTVVSTDGAENQYAVDATGEIFFGTDYMAILTSSDASEMATYQMDDVSKVLFGGTVRVVDVSAIDLRLAPNPATGSFALQGMGSEPQTVTVYSMSGAMALQGRYSDGEPIDISALAKGIYMVRACTSVVKLIKR